MRNLKQKCISLAIVALGAIALTPADLWAVHSDDQCAKYLDDRAKPSRLIGERFNIEEVRLQLEKLTGVKPIEGSKKIPDRASIENRITVRHYLVNLLKSWGYEPVLEFKEGTKKKDKKSRIPDFMDEDGYYGDDFDDGYPRIGFRQRTKEETPKEELPEPKLLDIEQELVNIIIEIKGRTNPEDVIEVNAHYDTVYEGVPGADDNGSGLTTVLELARIFRETQPEKTIRFVFADLEERGFRGTTHHVRELKRKGEKLFAAIVIDMIGYSPSLKDGEYVLEVGREIMHKSKEGWEGSKALANEFAFQVTRFKDRSTKLRTETYGAKPGTADHTPYWDEGYPAVLIAAPFEGAMVNPGYHKPTDTMAAINWDFFSDIAKHVTETIARISRAQLDAQTMESMEPHWNNTLASQEDLSVNPAHDFVAQSEIDTKPAPRHYSYGGGFSDWSSFAPPKPKGIWEGAPNPESRWAQDLTSTTVAGTDLPKPFFLSNLKLVEMGRPVATYTPDGVDLNLERYRNFQRHSVEIIFNPKSEKFIGFRLGRHYYTAIKDKDLLRRNFQKSELAENLLGLVYHLPWAKLEGAMERMSKFYDAWNALHIPGVLLDGKGMTFTVMKESKNTIRVVKKDPSGGTLYWILRGRIQSSEVTAAGKVFEFKSEQGYSWPLKQLDRAPGERPTYSMEVIGADEFLGNWLSQNLIKPQDKAVEANQLIGLSNSEIIRRIPQGRIPALVPQAAIHYRDGKEAERD